MPRRGAGRKNIRQLISIRRAKLNQKPLARKVQLVNKFPSLVNNVRFWAAKNIMTGANVALRMPGDPLVAETNHPLTANFSDLSAGIIRTFFSDRFPSQELQTQ
jgi:hypothetical protein